MLDRPLGRRIENLVIRNPFNEKETPNDKLSVVDIKAPDERGELYNVEMQMHATPTYPERVLYYWARIYGEQLSDGDNYRQLKATISISFVNDALFPQVADHHLIFDLRSLLHPQLVFSECQAIHVIELPKFRKSAEELNCPIDAWCFFLKNAAHLDIDKLPPVLQRPAVQHAMEVLNVISKTDLDRERYLANVRWERDRRSFMEEVEIARKAAQESRIALEKAIADRIHLCQRLLKVPLTPFEELTTLSTNDLEAMAVALEKQLVG